MKLKILCAVHAGPLEPIIYALDNNDDKHTANVVLPTATDNSGSVTVAYIWEVITTGAFF